MKGRIVMSFVLVFVFIGGAYLLAPSFVEALNASKGLAVTVLLWAIPIIWFAWYALGIYAIWHRRTISIETLPESK